MTAVDFAILDWVQAHLRCGFLDTVVPWITMLGEFGAVWILLALVLLLRKDTRKAGLAVAIALVLDLVVCNLVLKNLVARPRPFWIREVALLVPPPSEFSFPSGHTAASFAAVGALWREKNRLKIPALVLAVLIALSRIYLYVHYPSDVLGGLLVGLGCGVLGSFLAGKWMERCKNHEK